MYRAPKPCAGVRTAGVARFVPSPVSAPIPSQICLDGRAWSRRTVGPAGISGCHYRPPRGDVWSGNALFGTLADLAGLLPVLPLIGGGITRLQPVFVQDVAEAVVRILADPGTAGRVYELVSPELHTARTSLNLRCVY